MTPFPCDALDRLAERLFRGEVLFFVGAGFSLDSEGNTTNRLIARLLARFLALSEQVPKGKELRRDLHDVFSLDKLKTLSPRDIFTATNVKRLAQDYYPVNDWMCSAYSQILASKPSAVELAKADRREEELLARVNRDPTAGWDLSRPFPRQLIPIDDLFELEVVERGKALFLETLGFSDLQVMAGDPFSLDFADVESSYKGRLLKRHHILARFAREGLCPILLTTNYDLLLEGAFRLSGLEAVAPGRHPSGRKRAWMQMAYRSFTRIGDGLQFYAHGSGHRSALLVKIHGCAGDYRLKRAAKFSWSAYLPSIVFTYREIQNWRADSWSRDLVRTLLRTRTVVFCGYSGMDPVIHDTFRSVYEEMVSRKNQGNPVAVGAKALDQDAPAYFFGREDHKEFYGSELLRAASRVAGVKNPSVEDHPNYLRFSIFGEFPILDELLAFLAHRAFRLRQGEALESDLRSAASLLLGRPIGDHELDALQAHFEQIQVSETESAARWSEPSLARASLHRIVGWTERFQAGFLRELACGEAIQRTHGHPIDLAALRTDRWYFPASERPSWAAWGTVLEIALRRRLAESRGVFAQWHQDTPEIEAGRTPFPSVFFGFGKARPVRECIAIAWSGTGTSRVSRDLLSAGAYRREYIWLMSPTDLPWTRHASLGLPGAETIWNWATRSRPSAHDKGTFPVSLGTTI